MVDRVKGVDGAGPSDRDHRGAHLAPQHVAVGPGDEPGAVDQGLHLRRHVGEIGRRRQNDAVGLDHLLDAVVGDVAVDDASAVLVLEALAARGAATDGLTGQLDQFRLDAFGLQFRKDLPDQNGGVAVFSGASVECHNLHSMLSLLLRGRWFQTVEAACYPIRSLKARLQPQPGFVACTRHTVADWGHGS